MHGKGKEVGCKEKQSPRQNQGHFGFNETGNSVGSFMKRTASFNEINVNVNDEDRSKRDHRNASSRGNSPQIGLKEGKKAQMVIKKIKKKKSSST